MISETHCDNTETETNWNKDWAAERVWNYGTSLSKGVSILFKRTHSLNIIVKENIEHGRLTTTKAEINGHKIQTINIYAPNNPGDKKRFLSNLSTVFDNEYAYILVGNFNCTQNNHLHRDPRSNRKDQEFQELDDVMNQNNLNDIFLEAISRHHVNMPI